MKKLFKIALCIALVFVMTACESETKKEEKNSYIDATIENEKVVIDISEIKEKATFINYEVDGIIIQLIAVKGTDKKVRVAFNTCQSCSPSPTAYFIQEGEKFICQNCKTEFSVNEIGEAKGGCNPAPIEEKYSKNNKIYIETSYLDEYKNKFKNWEGPTK